MDDVAYTGTPNGLMTWALNSNEVFTDPGPLVRGIFLDEGWSIAPTCTFAITPTTATVAAGGGGGTVTLTTQAGCAWTASSGNPATAAVTPTSGTGSATINYTVSPNGGVGPRAVALTIGGQTFSISQNGTGPLMSLDRTSLAFGAISSGTAFTAQTPAQIVRLTQASGAGVPLDGDVQRPVAAGCHRIDRAVLVGERRRSGSRECHRAVRGGPAADADRTDHVHLRRRGQHRGTGRRHAERQVAGRRRKSRRLLRQPGQRHDRRLGVAGGVGLGARRRRHVARHDCRDLVAGESVGFDPNCNGPRIYIGDAVFIDGARPDVQAANPGVPQNTRAGWGYLLLTNFLPNNGNGTFTLRAYGKDVDGHTIELSSAKTITCDNAHATRPFGAIDTPAQGQVVCGTIHQLRLGARRSRARTFPPTPRRSPSRSTTPPSVIPGLRLARARTSRRPFAGRLRTRPTPPAASGSTRRR